MRLGAFRVSLTVKDLEAARGSCQNLGFEPMGGNAAQPLPAFTEVREVQRRLREAGVAVQQEADEAGRGPAHFVGGAPDDNPILFDQHV